MSVNTMNDDHIAAMNSINAIIAILGLSDTLGISEQVAELKAQRDALTAENAGLKAAFNPEEISEEAVDALQNTAEFDWDSNDTGSWSWIENDTDVIRAVLEAIKPETPATDAFLAEMLAQGVEMFASSLKVAGSHEHPYSAVANEFVAQLRKGVQS